MTHVRQENNYLDVNDSTWVRSLSQNKASTEALHRLSKENIMKL